MVNTLTDFLITVYGKCQLLLDNVFSNNVLLLSLAMGSIITKQLS